MDPGKILIVDDEQPVCDFLADFLQGNDFQVKTALSGTEAIREIKSFSPDLILLDVAMPEMDGIEVLRNLRKSQILIPVIMVSGLRSQKIAEEAFELGASDYITKPIDLPELEKRITAILSQRK